MSGLMQRISDWIGEKLGPGSGSDKGKYVVVAVLALIIAGAVALTVAGLSGFSTGSSGSKEVRFKCLATGEEFTFEAGMVPEEWSQAAIPGPDGSMRMKNPKTGQHTVVMMDRCPNCQGHFLPPQESQPPRPGQTPPPSICPHCQTDTTKWHRDHRKR